LSSVPKKSCASELTARNMPIVTITMTSGELCSTGRMSSRSMSTPIANESTMDSRIASQTGAPESANFHVM
jgi:hypothetical protein